MKMYRYLFTVQNIMKQRNVVIYILIRCEADEVNENDKLCNFWSKMFISKEIEMIDFKITGWLFMTLVEKKQLL